MKKAYIVPKTYIECQTAEVMQIQVNSYGAAGSVTGQTDTDWDNGGNGGKNDTPDAKKGFWDDDYED